MAIHCDNTSSTETNNSKKLPCINILSVDFDWIMAPSIQAYNEKIDDSGIISWNDVELCMPGVIFQADLKKYNQLMTYLVNIINKLPNADHFRYADSHRIIAACMENDWHIGDQPYCMYNIDHHHDCGYKMEIQDLTCANWVIKMQDKFPNLKKYTWINNFNSDVVLSDETLEKLPRFEMSSDISVINYVQFDYVFLCSSPGWTPPMYLPLFDAMTFPLENLVNK